MSPEIRCQHQLFGMDNSCQMQLEFICCTWMIWQAPIFLSKIHIFGSSQLSFNLEVSMLASLHLKIEYKLQSTRLLDRRMCLRLYLSMIRITELLKILRKSLYV